LIENVHTYFILTLFPLEIFAALYMMRTGGGPLGP